MVGDRVLAVEGQRDGGHPAGAVAPLGLDQGDVIGGDRLGELRLPPLALGVRHEGAGDPGRVEVVVDGAEGLVFGRVGDRVAVAAGSHVHRADVGGVGLAADGGAGEQLDGAVAEVALGRVVGGRLGVAGVRGERVPAEGLLAVGVGQHQLGPLRRQVVQAGGLVGQRAGVVDGAVRVEEPEAGEIVEPGGVARHDQRAGVGLAPHHGAGVRHGVGDEGFGPAHVALDREVLLVQCRIDRHIGPRRAEGERVGQAERRLQELEREELGLGDAVTLVLLVVLDHEVAGAHEAGHRCHRVHVGGAVLDRAVRRVERVGRGDGAQNLLLA